LSAMISSPLTIPACAAGEPTTTEITVGRTQVRSSASRAKDRYVRGRLCGVTA
jgi:hypothetical protein